MLSSIGAFEVYHFPLGMRLMICPQLFDSLK